MATKTATSSIASIEDRAEIAAKRARQAEIRKQLEAVDAQLSDINHRQNTAREVWLESRARAIADGRPEPERPMAFDGQVSELHERRHILGTAHGMIQREISEAAENASVEVRQATKVRRIGLYRAEATAARSLVDSLKQLQAYEAEMAAAGVYVELVHAIDLGTLQLKLDWFVERIAGIEGEQI